MDEIEELIEKLIINKKENDMEEYEVNISKLDKLDIEAEITNTGIRWRKNKQRGE